MLARPHSGCGAYPGPRIDERAELLRRVFMVDAEVCPRCEGRGMETDDGEVRGDIEPR